jgi:hypothetical protein
VPCVRAPPAAAESGRAVGVGVARQVASEQTGEAWPGFPLILHDGGSYNSLS